MPGAHRKWLLIDIVRPIVPAIFVAVLVLEFMIWSENRILVALELAIVGFLFFISAYITGFKQDIKKLTRKIISIYR